MSFPRDRKFYAQVTHGFDSRPFMALDQFDPVQKCFAAEDEPTNGLPSFGMVPVNVIAYLF